MPEETWRGIGTGGEQDSLLATPRGYLVLLNRWQSIWDSLLVTIQGVVWHCHSGGNQSFTVESRTHWGSRGYFPVPHRGYLALLHRWQSVWVLDSGPKDEDALEIQAVYIFSVPHRELHGTAIYTGGNQFESWIPGPKIRRHNESGIGNFLRDRNC